MISQTINQTAESKAKRGRVNHNIQQWKSVIPHNWERSVLCSSGNPTDCKVPKAKGNWNDNVRDIKTFHYNNAVWDGTKNKHSTTVINITILKNS